MAESTVVKPVSAEVEKQDRKRKKAEITLSLENICQVHLKTKGVKRV